MDVVLPYATSQTSGQSLVQNHFTDTIYSYNQYEQWGQYGLMTTIGTLLAVAIFVLVIINVAAKANHYLQVIDFMQFVAATQLLEIQFSPVLEAYLKGLSTILLSFLPDISNTVPYAFSPSKFIHYYTDSSLLRTQGLSFILFVISLATILILILINHYKPHLLIRVVARLRYRHLLDLFTIFMLPLMLFSFHFSNTSPVDVVASILVVLSSLVFLIVISYKLITAKNMAEIPGLAGELEKTSNPLGQMYTPFGYLRKFIFAFMLCLQSEKPISTLTLLLIFTILILVCLYFYQPFANQVTDFICIFMEVVLVIYVLLLIIFALNAVKGSSAHSTGIAAIVSTLIGFVVGIAWLVYLTFKAMKNYCAKLQEEADQEQPVEGQDCNPNLITVKKK